MTKIITILVLISLALSCGSGTEIKKIEFQFYPAFSSKYLYAIDIDDKILTQTIFGTNPIDENQFGSLHRIIPSYYVKSKQEFPIANLEMDNFINSIKACKLVSNIKNTTPKLDGSSFKMTQYYGNNDSIYIRSNNIGQADTLDNKILEAFFKLAFTTIHELKPVHEVENIHSNFSNELTLRKTNDNPLEYKIWGSFSCFKEYNKKLISFLDSLPNNEPILFDLRNADCYCLEELFDDYIIQKNMYFFGDRRQVEAKDFMDYVEEQIEKGKDLEKSEYAKYLKIKRFYDNRTISKRSFLNRLGIISELGINPKKVNEIR